jgi:dihydrolipoamide dehydrogenase
MKKNKMTVVEGEGRSRARGKLAGRRHGRSGQHIIVATGARARDLPFAKADGSGSGPTATPWCPRSCRPAAGHRIGRDRGRVRELLFGHGRRGDDRRDARPHPPRRGSDVSAFVHKALTKQGMKIHVSSGRRQAGADAAACAPR